jgi:hypothetical protein
MTSTNHDENQNKTLVQHFFSPDSRVNGYKTDHCMLKAIPNAMNVETFFTSKMLLLSIGQRMQIRLHIIA